MLLTVRIRTKEEPKREQVANPGGLTPPAAPRPCSQAAGAQGQKKIGRNDPCPCGSGLKYKKCCGRNEWAAKEGVT